ncbi:MAG: amidophosphoribosyltransferase [Deltaproteobacteria bacterium]|nr:amidophosphoribosyltransferase [Deltaproteobacteria bacterium]
MLLAKSNDVHGCQDDSPREKCGIFAIHEHPDAARVTHMGLFALQHRGQESAGIVAGDNRNVTHYKGMGLVADVFNKDIIARLKGNNAVGHVRYSTTGTSNITNAQPFLAHHAGVYYAFAHNGNLTNTVELHEKLEDRGAIFQSTMDTETIIHLMTPHLKNGLEKALVAAVADLQGAYSIVMISAGRIVAIRDPYGFKPLCLGKLDNSFVFASETCAFDLVGAKYIRDVEPGEIIIAQDGMMKSIKPFVSERTAFCMFELVYFARPDSHIFERNVYGCRKRMGQELAREYIPTVDFVMPFPDSGNYAAIGFAQESKIPFEMGMIRNHYIGRTFIQPTQAKRDLSVRVKLNPVRELIEGKSVLIVEDSIVRGTTSRNRVRALREVGVKAVHMAVSCPRTCFPCPYGIDFSSKGELLAAQKETEPDIADFIGLDSVHYLSLEGMVRATGIPMEKFCLACFNGDYPIKPPEKMAKLLFEQESLLEE